MVFQAVSCISEPYLNQKHDLFIYKYTVFVISKYLFGSVRSFILIWCFNLIGSHHKVVEYYCYSHMWKSKLVSSAIFVFTWVQADICLIELVLLTEIVPGLQYLSRISYAFHNLLMIYLSKQRAINVWIIVQSVPLYFSKSKSPQSQTSLNASITFLSFLNT